MNTDISLTTNLNGNFVICIKDGLSFYYGVIDPNVFPKSITQDKYAQILSSAVYGYKKTFQDVGTKQPQIISLLVNDQSNYLWNIQIKFNNSYFSFEESINIPLELKSRDTNLIISEYEEKIKKLELMLADLASRYEDKCEQVNKLLTYNTELKKQIIQISNITSNSSSVKQKNNVLTFTEIAANILQNIAANQKENGV